MKYNVNFLKEGNVTTAKVGFGDPATTAEMVAELNLRKDELTAAAGGGKLVLVDGPAALPVAMCLGHMLYHLFGAVAVKDPKLSGFVVSVSHDPSYAVGDILDATGVKIG